ncbi:MFS transporter [Lactobacillus terrae]|uniref:MFS transporter n=1 Tax=Lactobacillus terrae TaxID=2269374 RepID=UPI001FE6FE73|nr:MFS transporter [Lactobacillus terrae]
MLLSAKHLTPFTSATILTIALALSAVASVSIEKISQRIGTKRAISIFLGITLISFAMIKGEYFITLLIAYFAIEFSFEFVDTSLNAVVQDASNDQIRTSLISSVNTLTAGLMFLETIIITSLFSRFGVIDSFVVYGVVAVILTGISFIAFMNQQRKVNNN